MDAFTLFMRRKQHNAWIKYMGFSIYVRRGYHNIDGLGGCHTLDIANITLPERLRGAGRFHNLLTEIEKVLIGIPGAESILYVESILNPRFESALLRIGFKYAQQNMISPSMYRCILR